MFSCTRCFPFSCHAIFLLFNWSIEHTFFCFSNIFPPQTRKHLGNCLVMPYFCCCIVCFSFAADVMMTLHPVFRSSVLVATSYGKEIYLDTKKLQEEEIQNARAKNQITFLYKCMSNNVTPNSLWLRAPIKTTKCENIIKELRRKLLTHARNETKRRLHESKIRISNICSAFSQVLSPEDYENIMGVTDTSKDAEY